MIYHLMSQRMLNQPKRKAEDLICDVDSLFYFGFNNANLLFKDAKCAFTRSKFCRDHL